MYSKEQVLTINKDLEGKGPIEVIAWAATAFGEKNIAFSSSLSIEDQVITDILARHFPDIEIFTLDTGKLPDETFDLIDKTEARYGIVIKKMFPDEKEVEEMIDLYGKNSFYKSLENRQRCCDIRKIRPLRSKLYSFKSWITGLRREQSVTRTLIEKVEIDEVFNLVKINPIVDWTEQKTWEYIKKNDVPYNALYDAGYRSIGCAPCSRALKPGEDVRAGRWWWEQAENKECGLHEKKERCNRK